MRKQQRLLQIILPFLMLFLRQQVNGCNKGLKFKFPTRFGKLPIIAIKAKPISNFKKLEYLDDANIDDLGRYKDKVYINYLYKSNNVGIPRGAVIRQSSHTVNRNVQLALTSVQQVNSSSKEDFEMEWTIHIFGEGNITYKVRTSELQSCFRELKISKSQESSLVYICYQWSSGPYVFLWVLLFLLGIFYIILPPFLTIFYIRNIQGKNKSCFIEVGSDEQHYVDTENRKLKGKSLVWFVLFAILCIGILIGIVSYFFMTNYDLRKEDASSILFRNRLIRICISIASLMSLIFLSILNTTVKIWFPLFLKVCEFTRINAQHVNKEKTNVKSCNYLNLCFNAGSVCCNDAAIFICSSPILFIECLFNLFRVSLKFVFPILFGIPIYLSEITGKIYIWRKAGEYDLTELLNYGFLSNAEMTQWISKVEVYVSIIQNAIQSKSFVKFLVENEKLKHYQGYQIKGLEGKFGERIPRITFLHTGSIPEQFGKPLMVFGDLDRLVSNSFAELRSDHDVMFVMEHMPVHERGQKLDKCGFWLKARLIGEQGSGEFVNIIPMVGSSQFAPIVKNTIASRYLKTIISSTFFKGGKISEEGKNLPLEINTSELGSTLTSPFLQDISYKMLLTKAGPSINMKVTGHRSKTVFDCDFLLSFPVPAWPSPAEEWRTRTRAWPDQQTVDWLISLPCHLIAKPIADEDEETWRFSFSRQEIELARILPLRARLCYIGLKFIFKKHMKNIFSGLKSYHMLTLFFWFLEQRQPYIWIQQDDLYVSFESIFSSLMVFVANALKNGIIPHFFIRSINLLSIMKIDRKERNTMKDVSNFIMEIIEKKNFLEGFLYDRTAYDAMVLNRPLHEKVVQDRKENACHPGVGTWRDRGV